MGCACRETNAAVFFGNEVFFRIRFPSAFFFDFRNFLSFLVQIFGENFAARALSDARSRLAGRQTGPNQKMHVLNAWVGQGANPPPRFRVRTLPFSRGSFNLLARLVIGELPVGRTRAVYQHRSSLSGFGKSWFGKRACLHCFLEKDTLVLDSEWHWIFDCPKCNGIRAKHPYLRDSLESIWSNSEYAELNDLCKRLYAIQIDSGLCFSVVSFVRQAIALRRMLACGAASLFLPIGAVI